MKRGILASLQDAARFFAVPVVTLADSLYHRLQIHYPFGIKAAQPRAVRKRKPGIWALLRLPLSKPRVLRGFVLTKSVRPVGTIDITCEKRFQASLRDAPFSLDLPGTKVPGYLHSFLRNEQKADFCRGGLKDTPVKVGGFRVRNPELAEDPFGHLWEKWGELILRQAQDDRL